MAEADQVLESVSETLFFVLGAMEGSLELLIAHPVMGDHLLTPLGVVLGV